MTSLPHEVAAGSAPTDSSAASHFRPDSLSDGDYTRLGKFIHAECGIDLGSEKRTMLEGWLRKRLRVLCLPSFAAYCNYLFSKQGLASEPAHLFDTVTTNTTSFFRESRHFDYILSSALPDLEQTRPASRPIVGWSAASSSGEEAYTLALVLAEYAAQHPGLTFQVIATDISSAVLEKARLSIYDSDAIRSVPTPLLHRYFLRGSESANPRFRIAPELRALVDFRRMNLMDHDFPIREPVDLLFCRNVLIYFDRDTQFRLFSHLIRHLRPGGYLFLGHAESISRLDLPVEMVEPTVYRKVHAGYR